MLRSALVLAPAALILLGIFASPARAHLGSTKYLHVEPGSNGDVGVRVALETVDVAMQLGLGEDAPASAVLARAPEVTAWLLAGIGVRGATPCSVQAETPVEEQRDARSFIAVQLRFQCVAGEPLTLRDDTVFPDDRQHEALVYLAGRADGAAVLRTGQRELVLGGPPRSAADLALTFVWEGMLHFALGFDHVLFLLSLILGVGLGAVTQPTFRNVLRDLAWLVTAFTVGHSVTLALAALEIVVLPSQPVEIAIAASIVAVALHTCVRPHGRRVLPWVAGVFGLIHGFGFSSVLRELGLPREDTVLALVSFNVGIELAQLAFVALAIGPLLAAAKRPAAYERGIVRGGSLVIALVALYWVVERALGA